MGHSERKEKSNQTSSNQSAKDNDKKKTAEVLYQKIGDRWYAYSVVDEDVFMGQVPEETIEAIRNHSIDGKN